MYELRYLPLSCLLVWKINEITGYGFPRENLLALKGIKGYGFARGDLTALKGVFFIAVVYGRASNTIIDHIS